MSLTKGIVVIYTRMSDNVLDDEDYPVHRLVLKDGVVTERTLVQRGVYTTQSMPDVGWTLDQVEAWLSYDGTGSHPETFHQFQTAQGLLWLGVYEFRELRKKDA